MWIHKYWLLKHFSTAHSFLHFRNTGVKRDDGKLSSPIWHHHVWSPSLPFHVLLSNKKKMSCPSAELSHCLNQNFLPPPARTLHFSLQPVQEKALCLNLGEQQPSSVAISHLNVSSFISVIQIHWVTASDSQLSAIHLYPSRASPSLIEG